MSYISIDIDSDDVLPEVNDYELIDEMKKRQLLPQWYGIEFSDRESIRDAFGFNNLSSIDDVIERLKEIWK